MSDEAKERLVLGGNVLAALIAGVASLVVLYMQFARQDVEAQARDNVMVPELAKRVERIESDTRKTREAVHDLHVLVAQISERLKK